MILSALLFLFVVHGVEVLRSVLVADLSNSEADPMLIVADAGIEHDASTSARTLFFLASHVVGTHAHAARLSRWIECTDLFARVRMLHVCHGRVNAMVLRSMRA